MSVSRRDLLALAPVAVAGVASAQTGKTVQSTEPFGYSFNTSTTEFNTS